RNPAVASLGAVAAVLLLALAIGGPVAAYRQGRLRQTATAANERADANLDLASQALEQSLDAIEDPVRRRPHSLEGVDRAAWQAAVPVLEEFLRQDAVTPHRRARRARSALLLARTHADAGRNEQAEALFAQSLTEFDELTRLNPGSAEYQRGQASA